MTAWLRHLGKIRQEIPPGFKMELPPMEKGDKELGKLSPDLISLLTVLCWLAKQINDYIEECGAKYRKEGKEHYEEFRRNLAAMQNECAAVKEIFAVSVFHELGFSPYTYPMVTVRDGNMVVSIPREKSALKIFGPFSIMDMILDAADKNKKPGKGLH